MKFTIERRLLIKMIDQSRRGTRIAPNRRLPRANSCTAFANFRDAAHSIPHYSHHQRYGHGYPRS